MTALLVALAGMAVGGGAVLAVAGWLRTEVSTPVATHRWRTSLRRRWGLQGPKDMLRLAVGVVVGVALFAFTGWPLALLLGPLALLGIPALLADPPTPDVALLEALDRWVRTLAATLPTGRSITDSMRISVPQTTELLRPGIELALLRIDDRWTTPDALRALADELSNPDADSVIAALMLAAHRGGTGATATLTALSDSIQERLRAYRDVEAERAKPRIVVRQVTVITLVVLVGSLMIGRDFFTPYGTPMGQLILAALVAAYVASLVALRRLTTPRRRERILARGVAA